MDYRLSLLNPKSNVLNWGMVRRWSSGHAHGEHEHVPSIPPYRRPLIPANRPMAFILGGVLIAGALSLTGFFLWPAVPKQIPEHKLDRKPKYEQSSLEAMTVHWTRPRGDSEEKK
jgi:hypothetical protein